MFTVNFRCVLIFALTLANYVISSHIGSNGCILPAYPEHGRWTIHGAVNHAPGEKVENGVAINITCNAHYKLNSSSVPICVNGRWSGELGECLELCQPIEETYSTRVTCTTINGEKTNCRTPTNGTVATIKCAPYYENAELNRNPFRICKNGQWSEKILSCRAVCGLKPILSKSLTLTQYYPWHINLYFRVEDTFLNAVGTLISEKAILTWGTIIMYKYKYPDSYEFFKPENILVAAGKTFESLEIDEPEAQYSLVKDVFLPDNFKGPTTKYLADIAVIIASTPFKMTSRIQPVCVDWLNKYRDEFRPPNVIAKAAAPMPAEPNETNSVFESNIPLVSDRECYKILLRKPGDITDGAKNYSYHFTLNVIDKFCAGGVSMARHQNCSHDLNAGTGLIAKNSYNEKYYVIGVAAWGSLEEDCNINKAFTLFTRVSDYVGFIAEKTNLYSNIEQDPFQAGCGTKSVHAQALIVNGSRAENGDYPWQVAIYTTIDSRKIFICSGSLINQRIVLTAAHCVTDGEGEKLPLEQFEIAAGKYYRNFDDSRDNNAQFSALKKIILPAEYKGHLQNYLGDIAILVSETSFNLSRQIQPICVDWQVKYESLFLKPNITGFIAGWGFTQENQSLSKELRDLEVPYIDTEQCRNELPIDFETFLTNDKFCSGFLNKGKSACSGDSGGGLIFKNKIDDRYYLVGVVSVSPQSKYGCDSQQYTLYTQVSKYVHNFIRETVSLYWS